MENACIKENICMEWEGTVMTDKGVVVLQNCVDLPKVKPGSYSDMCLPPHAGNNVTNIKVEELLDIKEEEDSIHVPSSVIKDEHKVSCIIVYLLLNHFINIENWILSFSFPFVCQHETNPHWRMDYKVSFPECLNAHVEYQLQFVSSLIVPSQCIICLLGLPSQFCTVCYLSEKLNLFTK
jgi:hypothetical protein